jgi:hypothetical protein
MQAGVKDELTEVLQAMPDLADLQIGDWLDLLAIRTRLPNFFGFAQVNADNHICSLMPYAQPEVLDAVFQIPAPGRKNGKLLKRIVKQNSRALTKFHLVKFNTDYPFYLSTVLSYLYSKGRTKVGKSFTPASTRIFLYHLEEYVQDTIHSQSVKTNPLYDYTHIKHMVKQFYNGKHSYQGELDWWLSFELFNQSLAT